MVVAMRCFKRCDVYQFLTMRCFGDVLTKTLPSDVFNDVLKKPKHRDYDAYKRCFYDDGNISRSKMEPKSSSAPNATSISVKLLI